MKTITKPPTAIPYQSAYPQIVEEESSFVCGECNREIPDDDHCHHCDCFYSGNHQCDDQCDECTHRHWCNKYGDRGYEMDLHVIPGSRLTYWA